MPENTFFKNKRKEFTAILEALRHRKNWEVHYYLGLSYLQDQRKIEAKTCFQQSLKSIESDTKLIQEDWAPRKQAILTYIKNLNEDLGTEQANK